MPTHDGGQEVISARFLHPAAALQEFADGKIQFMLPQYYILATLCDILQGSENTASQREKVEILSRGAFGAMVINPKSIPGAQPEGSIVLSYEGDETHGGPKGRLHRAVLILGKGGVCLLTLEICCLGANRLYRFPRRSRCCGTLIYSPKLKAIYSKALSFEFALLTPLFLVFVF